MRLLMQAMAVLATVVVIALFVVLATPKAAHAIVATLIRDVDQPARHALAISCSAGPKAPAPSRVKSARHQRARNS